MRAMDAAGFSREAFAGTVPILAGPPTARATAQWIKSIETNVARAD